MSRKNAAPKQDLCYDAPMKAVAAPDVAKKEVRRRKPLPHKKHIVTPASAEEISRSVGVTKKDAAIVDKILRRLGYIHDQEPTPKKIKGASKTLKTKKKS